MKKTTNILIRGLYRSGSHALVDLLSEYDNVGVLPFEFNHFRAPANVADQLSENMCRDWPNMIEKSLNIKGMSWKYKLIRIVVPEKLVKIKLISRFLKTFPRLKGHVLLREYHSSLELLNRELLSEKSHDEKIESTKNWIADIARIYAPSKDFLVLDQPILRATDINVWPKVFEPYKLVFSIRNPKDQLADIVRSNMLFRPFGAPTLNWPGGLLECIYGREKSGAMNIFIDAIKGLYRELNHIEKHIDPRNLLIVEFEKLVFDYERQKKRIEDFTGVSNNHHTRPNSRFIPEISAQNVNFYREYLNDEELRGLAELEELYNDRVDKLALQN